MNLAKRAKQTFGIAGVLARDPDEVRHLRRLAATIGRHPLDTRLPWLAFDVIDWLDTAVNSESVVFEYGAGGSTAFFADRVSRVISAEHDAAWANRLRRTFTGARNVEILEVRPGDDYEPYVALIEAYEDESFDLVLVDGRERVKCIERAAPKVRPGGYIVLDDAERANYQRAFVILDAWNRRDFQGITPGKATAGHTSVWMRPFVGPH